MHPPRAMGTLVARYPALVVPASGKYRFALRYKLENGEPSFGASIGDGSAVSALSTRGHPAESDRETDFWVDLKSGQEIHLGIMNNAEDRPATSFLMKAVTAVEVLDAEVGIGERPPQ